MDLTTISSTLFILFGYITLIYMIIVLIVYTSMLLTSLFQLNKHKRLDKYMVDEESLKSFYSQPVSILVPAYNEEIGIVGSVYSLLKLQYAQYEIIIINDGSTDETEQTVIDTFQMVPMDKPINEQIKTEQVTQLWKSSVHPHLFLITKENGGKADALNAGINLSKYPYFCSIDGDSFIEERSLLRVMRSVTESNKKVIAAGGTVRIANGSEVQMGTMNHVSLPSQTLVVMQIIEYIRAFFMGRTALSRHNLVLIISGAFSIFSKQEVINVGGYDHETVGEDMELVVRLHHAARKDGEEKEIVYVPDPVCWTEAPADLAGLRTQRKRWHQGLAESLWKHKTMLFNPKYGKLGMISMPYFTFIELFGPLIELSGYLYMILSLFMGDAYIPFAALLALLFILYGSLFSMMSVLLEAWSQDTFPEIQDLTRLLFLSFTEAFWYRPLTLFWRSKGIFAAIIGNKGWGTIERKGL